MSRLIALGRYKSHTISQISRVEFKRIPELVKVWSASPHCLSSRKAYWNLLQLALPLIGD